MTTKMCPKCKEDKSIDSYYKDASKSSGISSYCKVCCNSRKRTRKRNPNSAKRWRERNPEKSRDSVRRWRERNPEIAKERCREYYHNNIEKERERCKLYHRHNPEKSRESRKRWEKNNPEKVKEHSRKYQKKKSYKRKMFSIEYKGGKCEDCGITASMENRSIFDFHHLNPSNKKDDINEIHTRSIERLKEELDKCVLLCANCHRLRHQNYQDGLRPTL